jgi:hypothetical protein
VTTLDDLLDQDVAQQRARAAGQRLAGAIAAGLWGAGWALAKFVHLLLFVIGGVLYSVGWIASRALWPAACWCGRAVRLGWQDARRRDGG